MESNMQRKAAGLKDKIPDIQKTLETVQFLRKTVCFTRPSLTLSPLFRSSSIRGMGVGRRLVG
jgi:hypothetical protein